MIPIELGLEPKTLSKLIRRPEAYALPLRHPTMHTPSVNGSHEDPVVVWVNGG